MRRAILSIGAVAFVATVLFVAAGGPLLAVIYEPYPRIWKGTQTYQAAVTYQSTVSGITTLGSTNIDVGASGTAGSVDIFPSTAAKGKLAFVAADSAGDTTTTITNASQAGARTYTVPDAGASASFVMTEGNQTVNGAKTFGAVPITPAGGITLGSTTITEAEGGVLDGVTPGTVTASKALVVDASKDLGDLRDVTARDLITTSGVGTVNGTGATVTEFTAGVHRTVIAFSSTPVAMADEAGVVAYGSLKVYDWPEGAITILGATTDLDLSLDAAGVNADWDGDVGVGTGSADNDGSLASTEQDIVPTTATPQATSSTTTANAQSTSTESGSVFDGTATAADVYVNLLVDDADHDVGGTPTNIVLDGTMTILWSNLGDY